MIIDVSEDGYTVTWESMVTGTRKSATIVQLIEAFEAEPKHGRWKRSKYYPRIIICDECGEPYELSNSMDHWVYCPNCGARMDLIGEDKSHPFAESVMMGMNGGEND